MFVLVQSLHADVRAVGVDDVQLYRVLGHLVELLQEVGGDNEEGLHLFLLSLVDVFPPGYRSETGGFCPPHSPGYEREQPVEDLTHLGAAHLVHEEGSPRVVGVAETVLARQHLGLEQEVPGRHVGVAVDEVNVGDAAVVHPTNLSLDRSNTGLVDKAEPDHGEDVEGVPEGEKGPPASHLPPAQHSRVSVVRLRVPPELVGAHEDDARQDGDEEPRLLVLHTGEAQ